MMPINIFDFDGTLTTETWPKFWVWVKKFGYSGIERNDELETALAEYRQNHAGDHLETFFGFFNDLLKDNQEVLTDAELLEGKKHICYNPGVEEFLRRGQVRNYIVSGGLRDFLAQLEVAKFFEDIYGTPVQRNEDGLIVGIGEVMTDDKKILAIQDILKQNNRDVNDCRDVYYIGDGYSDMPAMRYVHDRGGRAIFVYVSRQGDQLAEQHNKMVYEALSRDGVVDCGMVADYRYSSDLSNLLLRKS